MKSCRVFLIAFCSFVYINLSAQVFVGGSARFNSSKNKEETSTLKESSYNLDLNPSVGKFLSEKLALGLALDFSLSVDKIGLNLNTDRINRSSGTGVSLFLRYYALKWNKLSVYGQGNVGIEFSNSSVKTRQTTNMEKQQTREYLSIFPGLAYDITEKLSLETSLNILSLGYSFFISKVDTFKEKGSNFNIGAGLGNIVSLNAITIGAIFKF